MPSTYEAAKAKNYIYGVKEMRRLAAVKKSNAFITAATKKTWRYPLTFPICICVLLLYTCLSFSLSLSQIGSPNCTCVFVSKRKVQVNVNVNAYVYPMFMYK